MAQCQVVSGLCCRYERRTSGTAVVLARAESWTSVPHSAATTQLCGGTCCFPPSMRNHSSGMVGWDVVPQPTLTLGLVGGCGVVALVARRVGNRITENLVNYIPRRWRRFVHERPRV